MTANIADFVSFEWIDSNHIQGQSMILFECLQLFSDTIGHEVKYPRFGKIFSEGPAISLAGKVSAAPVSQDHVNRVPLAHTMM